MNSETCQRIALRRYASLLLAACFSISCYPDFPCEMMGTCPLDNPEAGIVDGTGTESDVSSADQNTSSNGTAHATLADAESETSSTGTASETEATSSTIPAACVPVSDDGCSGETPWCLAKGETESDSGILLVPRCVECEEDSHCQWPIAPPGESGVCLDYVCTPCEVATNRGCDGDAPYCVEGSTLAATEPDASVGHNQLSDEGSSNNTTQCVECLTESDCGGDTPACVGHACVTCDKDEQCGDTSASRCNLDTNTCAPCNAVGQCAHLSNTPTCEVSTGTCVECTREEQTKCDNGVNGFDYACVTIPEHPGFQTCSDQQRENSSQCAECISDGQCRAGFKCVMETFALYGGDAGSDQPTDRRYCMALESELGDDNQCGDNRPFIGSFRATSEGDATERTYCRPRYTTCAAHLMHGNGPETIPAGSPGAGGATCFSNDSCGLPGLNDGFCVRFTANANRCTYECASQDDCVEDFTCNKVSPPAGIGQGRGVCAVTTNPPSGGSEP